ncbi:MAG: DUF4355 domain-containing protein [Clostridia bacterium]|nr:DUF4355 domain-containing protein [Clostridia bacterium]
MEEEKKEQICPAEPVIPRDERPPISVPAAPSDAAPAPQQAAPDALPQESADAGEVARLEQEVAALRQERLRRLMLEEARTGLEERGIAAGFAPFLLGEDPADTRRKLELFEREYHHALRAQLAPYLGGGEPRDFSASHSSRRRPGIRRLS